MRSLDIDRFRPSLIGLLSAIVLLTAWLAWFFLASVGLYEVSQSAQVTGAGMIVADFPLETRSRIWPGQPALFRPASAIGDLPQTIPAMVMAVTRPADREQVQVKLVALADAKTPISLPEGFTGQIEIEVKRVSPATLVRYTTGQLVDGPAVSLSR
jgi:hypothetical protein